MKPLAMVYTVIGSASTAALGFTGTTGDVGGCVQQQGATLTSSNGSASKRGVGGAPDIPPPTAMRFTAFTRRFNVQITGTMTNFEVEGPSTAQLRPVEGQHVKIFTNANAKQDLGSAFKVLQSTWLVKATVLEQKNSFPVPLSINVSCIKGQEHVDTGKCYSFTALPMTHNPTPLVILEPDTSAQTSQEWRRNWGECTANTTSETSTHNMHLSEPELLLCQPDLRGYAFVHENHAADECALNTNNEI